MKKIFPFLLVFIFLIAYLVPRLVNINQKLEFRSDQGIHLLEVKEMIDSHRLRLLGPAVTSQNMDGREFFIGATYYYVLAILGVISNWSPLLITINTIIFESIIYALFINFIRDKFNYTSAIFVAFLISFLPYLIFHSLFFWNPHFLIPLSILFILLRKNPYLSAFIWGLAFSFHYSAVFWIVPYLYFRYSNQQFKLKILLLSFILFILANFPFIFSEFRHQFYNIKTIFLVFSSSTKSFEITPHYFVFSLSIFIIYFLVNLSKKVHLPLYFLLLFAFLIVDNASYKHLIALNYPQQLTITREISNKCPHDFNIATTIGGDTRSYDLRYLLNINKCPPNSVDNYPQSSVIYIVAPPSRHPETETVWEISSFKPFTVTKKVVINDNVIFYRLDKS